MRIYRKITKTILKSILSTALFFGGISSSINVYAHEISVDLRETSAADYKNFLEYANGKVFDIHGNESSLNYVNEAYPWDGQCVSLIQAYLKYLGYPVISRGNASQWWTGRYVNGILDICDIVDTPQPGDIVISAGDSVYGHIFIYHDASVAFSQNYDNDPHAKLCSLAYQGQVFGYLRPKCKDGWKKDETGEYYLENGKIVKNTWKETESGWRYLNADGYLQKGFSEIDGNTYYFNVEGIMQTGWIYENGNSYYFSLDGSMVKGTVTIDGVICYFREDGVQVVNDWYMTDNGPLYIENGMMVKRRWISIEGNMYYMDADGLLDIASSSMDNTIRFYDVKTNETLIGWQTIDNEEYYFADKGFLQNEWYKEMGLSYYFENDGYLCTGFTEIDGDMYYFNQNMMVGWQNIDGNTYYFGNDGKMVIGWKTISNAVYYFNEDGTMQTGDMKIGGKDYSFDENGCMIQKVDSSITALTK